MFVAQPGAKPVGRKIGFTNRSIWPKYGVHQPIWGTVYDSTLIAAGGGKAQVALSGIAHPRIEPEICFKLRAAPRDAKPASLIAAIEWMAHSIEVVQCPHADWKVTLEECTSLNALHARLVVGAPMPFDARIAEIEVALMKNGAEVDRGKGSNVLDSPLLALGHLLSMLREPLSPGEIVSTGTLTDAHRVAPGETWSTRFSGLPMAPLEIRFT
ncbi:MAG: 2-keto-4-pentenoate hydratase [Betaproteobacteria bacterium]